MTHPIKLIISGYGRMGREVEKQALASGYPVQLILDKKQDWQQLETLDTESTVLIDFSLPETGADNILSCFDLRIPVVSGTTGWYEHLPEIRARAELTGGTLFYAPNFSIGVNLFFMVNRKLAELMSGFEAYKAEVKEIHHIHKLDAPSGTAIRIAEDIINLHQSLDSWENGKTTNARVLPVISERRGEVPGTHIISYDSSYDSIQLLHEAKNRSGFAKGALLAANWVYGKKGIYTMDDFLGSLT